MRVLVPFVLLAGFAWPQAASAANLAGTWNFNSPSNPTTWTITQTGPQFVGTAAVFVAPAEFDYRISGVTIGPLFIAQESVAVPSQGVDPYNVGIVLGTVTGDTLTGYVVSRIEHIIPLTGTRTGP